MARKMKDSGIEWIGEIPTDFSLYKLKYLLSSPLCYGANESGTLYSDILPRYIRITDISPNGTLKNSGMLSLDESSAQNYMLHEGDILFARSGATVGKSFIYHNYYGRAAYAGYLIKASFNRLVLPEFVYYYTCSSAYEIWKNSIFIQSTIQNIGADRYSNLPISVPNSIDKQLRIVRYLNNFCSKFDAIIYNLQTSIEDYKKLKQAIITQAVTKGVRGEREMKDSGVKWIGEIPKEWRKTQLRHCATIKSGITLGKSYSKDTVLIERPYLRVANVQGGYVDLNDLATIQVTPDEDLKYRLHSGDVLMTEGGDRDKLGRGCVWHGEIEPCLHQNHVFAVQTNETILLPEFLEYLTASDVGRSYFDVTAIKTTNLACTSSSKVLAFTIPLPPIEEQIEIVSFIKERSLKLNKLIMKKGLLVQELESYKKSLIYEVVTGKREV